MSSVVTIQRGMRGPLAKSLSVDRDILIQAEIFGPSVYDFCCFGLDKRGKLSDDRYMIFYNQLTSPLQEIQYQAGDNVGKFLVNLSKFPDTIERLVFTVSIDGNGTMDQINSHGVYFFQKNECRLKLELRGRDFRREKAIISVEVYRRNGEWRFAGTASGFNGGLADLLEHFSAEPAYQTSRSQPAPHPQPQPVQPVRSVQPVQPVQRVQPVQPAQPQQIGPWEMKPGKEITAHLNWNHTIAGLSLACLYETKSHEKGCIQKAGHSFGTPDAAPFISLNASDYGREVLRIGEAAELQRLVFFAYVEEGVSDWQRLDGVLLLRQDGGQEIPIRLDDFSDPQRMCAAVVMEAEGDTLRVRKQLRLVPDQREVDKAFGWGLYWGPGS